MGVTAWNNGAHHACGAGYGLKIQSSDRGNHFNRDWHTVISELPDGVAVEVNIEKHSFWGNTCRELISKQIGPWSLDTALAPWPDREPPKLDLKPAGGNCFWLSAGVAG